MKIPIIVPMKFAYMSFTLYVPSFIALSHMNSLNKPTRIVIIVAMNTEFVKVNNTISMNNDNNI